MAGQPLPDRCPPLPGGAGVARRGGRSGGRPAAGYSLTATNSITMPVSVANWVAVSWPFQVSDCHIANHSPPIATKPATQIEKHHISASRSEEHTSELQSLMRISYAVYCLKNKNTPTIPTRIPIQSHTPSTDH